MLIQSIFTRFFAVLSVDQQLRLGKSGIVDAINDFNTSQQQVTVYYDFLNEDHRIEDQNICKFVDFDSFMMIVEAREPSMASPSNLKLLARNAGIPMISQSVDELYPNNMVRPCLLVRCTS